MFKVVNAKAGYVQFNEQTRQVLDATQEKLLKGHAPGAVNPGTTHTMPP